MAKSQKGPGEIRQAMPLDARGNPVPSADYSGEVTTTGALITEPCVLAGILIATDGAEDVTVQLHDGASATGVKLAPPITVAAADLLGGIVNLNVRVTTAVWAVITTSGTASVVGYFNS